MGLFWVVKSKSLMNEPHCKVAPHDMDTVTPSIASRAVDRLAGARTRFHMGPSTINRHKINDSYWKIGSVLGLFSSGAHGNLYIKNIG